MQMTQPAQQLASDGATVVRGFLAPADAADLRRTVTAVYAAMDSCERFPDRRLGQNFRVWDGVRLEALPKFLRQASPELAERYEQTRRRVVAQVARILGPQWRYFPKRSYFRRHLGMTKPVGWHIDADGATVFAVASSVINVWLPLDKVGTDLPSLEVVPRSRPFAQLEQLAEIAAPVVVVGSRDEADPEHPLAVAEAYARAIAGAQLVVEPDEQPPRSPIAWQGGQLSRVLLELTSRVRT